MPKDEPALASEVCQQAVLLYSGSKLMKSFRKRVWERTLFQKGFSQGFGFM